MEILSARVLNDERPKKVEVEKYLLANKKAEDKLQKPTACRTFKPRTNREVEIDNDKVLLHINKNSIRVRFHVTICLNHK